MADFLNGNAIYTQYEHLEDGGWRLSINSPCHCLTRMVEVPALCHRFAQDVLAVSHHSRQGPNR